MKAPPPVTRSPGLQKVLNDFFGWASGVDCETTARTVPNGSVAAAAGVAPTVANPDSARPATSRAAPNLG
ncbi:hypothetical protein Apa02nite_005790 [Actinoplanes palleronii]|uniref:Uncharacterized protein n=1 Tax=Actinoplanes palleronii TaxID=113570 RepID=A0ABQ4B1M0_9ACTN|nr:hypothetical protein Apa02nite_005790 [Actinoplanes palleronii]